MRENHTLEYLPPKLTAELLNVSLRTLERWRRDGTGPRFMKCGRRVLYAREAIDEWLTSHSFESTAEMRLAGVK